MIPGRTYYFFLICSFLSGGTTYAQNSIQTDTLVFTNDTAYLRTAPIFPTSFTINLEKDDYYLDPVEGFVVLTTPAPPASVICSYRVVPSVLTQNFYHRDTSIVLHAPINKPTFFKAGNNESIEDVFGASLNKTGSISRGITFGNNQNLSVNSNLNLQMSGKISPEIDILASVTDNNIPIQPQGNTQQLQDFDQVYIQVFNQKKWILTAGDFWLKKPTGYFMTYNKRAQGGSILTNIDLTPDSRANKRFLQVQASGAISKGKFARNLIQGIEGNQGPYRLTGANEEPFIIVLSGTERVFIDGRLLVRGQDNDYIIDYNTAELIFTPKNLITKDRRIVVEFQYSDLSYARSLFQNSLEFNSDKMKVWLNAYSEQDAKNQPLQLSLNDEQRTVLAITGDNISQAFASSVDTASFSENRLLYKKIDTTVNSITYNDILVYSTKNDTDLYRASFTNVGDNNGHYVLDQITALGRVYRWVEPVGGIPQGNYEPVILLAAPNKTQMVSSGIEYTFSKDNMIGMEAALSNYDKNTFSALDQEDNQGIAIKPYFKNKLNLNKKDELLIYGSAEYASEDFNPIERFRNVEFTRNWNTRSLTLNGDQIITNVGMDYIKKELGKTGYTYNFYKNGNDYSGQKHDLYTRLKTQRTQIQGIASYLITDGIAKSDFLRHKMNITRNFKWLKLSFNDEHERNIYHSDKQKSYQFYDWQATLSNTDSTKTNYNVFYRQRIDHLPDPSGSLKLAALARQYGIGSNFKFSHTQRLKFNLSYRTLEIKDSTLIDQSPENTFLGRLEHKGHFLKGVITSNTFYEIGSGLELRKEFQYIEVQPGQGTYTWIDYNENDIKELNEFEIAAFQDQANYIRVFTPTNEYVKIFTNQFSQSFFIKPNVVWRKEKGLKKFLARFSDQFLFRANRKTNSSDPNELYNPFLIKISDLGLISVSSVLRNTFYFNRTNQVFGMDYSYQLSNSKTLLTSGFDARSNESHIFRTRWNISKVFTIQSEHELGNKTTQADYISGRNYNITYHEQSAELSYQPNTSFRIATEGVYAEKENDILLGGEYARILQGSLKIRYNQAQKGTINGIFNYIINTYTGDDNTTLSYEMLNALKPGQNFTWTLNYQRSIGKNLQLNLNYNGRKSPDNTAIHTGGAQVRALF